MRGARTIQGGIGRPRRKGFRVIFNILHSESLVVITYNWALKPRLAGVVQEAASVANNESDERSYS